jgi:hypothetical protein
MNFVTFKSNVYSRNHASGGLGLIDIVGVPRIVFDTESFYSNGDSIKNVVDLYGGTGNYNNLGTSALDMTLATAYSTPIASSSLCQGMINI